MKRSSEGGESRVGVMLGVLGVVLAAASALIAYFAFANPRSPHSDPKQVAAYVQQVDALCTTAGASIRELGQPPEDYSGGIQFYQQLEGAYGRLFSDWTAVQIPKGDEDRMNKAMDTLRRITSEIDNLVQQMRDFDSMVSTSLQDQAIKNIEDSYNRVRDLINDLHDQFTSYGFHMCPAIVTI